MNESSAPYSFECPSCGHFPLRIEKNTPDFYYCTKQDLRFMLVWDLFGQPSFMRDLGKRGIKDWRARAFYRIPKSRAKGTRVFFGAGIP